jgi:hypothetical protein
MRSRSGAARVLAAPSAPLGRFEDTVVVDVHPVELGGRPPRRSLLRTLDVLLSREVAGRRPWRAYGGGRAWWSGSLLICLSQSDCRQ